MRQQSGDTHYPHYLLEATYSAPLTALEKDIVLFLMRRTYGWKRHKLGEGEALVDQVTVADMASAIQSSARSIERALQRLFSLGIVLKVSTDPVRRGVPQMYGVNPEIEDWGEGPDWVHWRVEMRSAEQLGLTTRARVVSLRRIAYRHYAPLRSDTTQNCVVEQATKPTATGPEVPRKTERQRQNGKDRTDRTSKALAPAPPARAETPIQIAIREAWEACGFEGVPGGRGYSGLVKLVQSKGLPIVREWVACLRAGKPVVPEGAVPWAWFLDAFRAALNRPWEWRGRGAVGESGQGQGRDAELERQRAIARGEFVEQG